MKNEKNAPYCKHYNSSLNRRIADAKIMFDLISGVRGSDIKQEDSILDIGCGPEELTSALWNDIAKNKVYLDGIDIQDYSNCNFWKQTNRNFSNCDFLKNTIKSKQYNIIWSCFSAHCITAKKELDKKHDREKLFFNEISKLLKKNGVFICQVPAVNDFFPLLSYMAEKVICDFNFDINSYKNQREKVYNIWPSGKYIPEIALKYNLETELDVTMASWRPISIDQSFNTWWSANLKILASLGIGEHNYEQFKFKWKEIFHKELGGKFHNESAALGCLHSRIMVFRLSSSDKISFSQQESNLQGLEWERQERMRNTSEKSCSYVNNPEKLNFNSELNTEDLFDFFNNDLNEPILGSIVSYDRIKNNIFYCMSLFEAERYRDFSNDKYEEYNKRRHDLLNQIIDSKKPFKRINPQAKSLECKGVVTWFGNSIRKEIFYLLSPEAQLKGVIHIIASDIYKVSANDLVVLMSNGVFIEDLFGGFKDQAAEEAFNYFAWHIETYPEQVLILVPIDNPNRMTESHSFVLSLIQEPAHSVNLLSYTDREYILRGLQDVARKTKKGVPWTDDLGINKALELFRANDQWNKIWTHNQITPEGSASKYIKKEIGVSLWADSIKALFLISDSEEPEWPHLNRINSGKDIQKTITIEDLNAILEYIGLDDSQLKLEPIRNKPWKLPVMPGIPFLLSIKQFLKSLTNHGGYHTAILEQNEKRTGKITYHLKIKFKSNFQNYDLSKVFWGKIIKKCLINQQNNNINSQADKYWDNSKLYHSLLHLLFCSVIFEELRLDKENIGDWIKYFVIDSKPILPAPPFRVLFDSDQIEFQW